MTCCPCSGGEKCAVFMTHAVQFVFLLSKRVFFFSSAGVWFAPPESGPSLRKDGSVRFFRMSFLACF